MDDVEVLLDSLLGLWRFVTEKMKRQRHKQIQVEIRTQLKKNEKVIKANVEVGSRTPAEKS